MSYKSIFDDPNWPQWDINRCRHLQSLGHLICDSVDHNENDGCSNPNCFKYKIEKPLELDKNTIKEILKHVKLFDCVTICEGDDSTEENRMINKYADGVTQGYKDAVRQISEMLEDLLQ